MNHDFSVVPGSPWLTLVQCECHIQLCSAGLRLHPTAGDGAAWSVLHNLVPWILKPQHTLAPSCLGMLKRTTHMFSSKHASWAGVWAQSRAICAVEPTWNDEFKHCQHSWKSTEEFSTPISKHLIFNNFDIFPIGLLPCLQKVTAATSLWGQSSGQFSTEAGASF